MTLVRPLIILTIPETVNNSLNKIGTPIKPSTINTHITTMLTRMTRMWTTTIRTTDDVPTMMDLYTHRRHYHHEYRIIYPTHYKRSSVRAYRPIRRRHPRHESSFWKNRDIEGKRSSQVVKSCCPFFVFFPRGHLLKPRHSLRTKATFIPLLLSSSSSSVETRLHHEQPRSYFIHHLRQKTITVRLNSTEPLSSSVE